MPEGAPSRHALVAPRVVRVFEELELAVSLWEPGRPHSWHVLFAGFPSSAVFSYELEHGAETERVSYNNRSIAKARRTRRIVVGRHAGFSDLFVPVRCDGKLDSVLVTGPFATTRPTSAEVLEQWRALTGRQGHPSDPEFSAYLTTTLSVLLLEGALASRLQRLTECFASLLRGEGDADAKYTEALALRDELMQARFVDRMWELARSMVDERTRHVSASPNLSRVLAELGLVGVPEQALVGLLVDRQRGSDPVDEVIRRDAFQRACVELAHKAGNVACGRIGGNGITLLCARRGAATRARRVLLDLADRASQIAKRRFGLTVHFGASAPSIPLFEQVQVALAAAETAVTRGVHLVQGEAGPGRASPLFALEKELGRRFEEDPSALPARFDRYLEALGARCGMRLDPARAYLEGAFARLVEALQNSGTFDERNLSALCSDLERAAAEAPSVTELFAAYRRAIDDISEAVRAPRVPSPDRNLRRAEDYMRKHYTEPLSLERVARVAGFSRTYFSELFRKAQGTTFEQHLIDLRIERAKQLLSATTLNLERVASLSGLSSRNYLGRIFKRFTRETPMQYRERVSEGLRVGNATRGVLAKTRRRRA